MKVIIRECQPPVPGKLADAELHFDEGPLDGLKLIGFMIWERRKDGARLVTFPSRQYTVNGERRSFALLRAIGGDSYSLSPLCERILAQYAEHEAMILAEQQASDEESPPAQAR